MSNTTNKQTTENLKFLFKYWYLLVVLVVLVVFPKKVLASQLSLGVYPPLTKIEAKAPAAVKTGISLINYGDEALELSPKLRMFNPENENGEISYPAISQNPQIFSKIKFLNEDKEIEKISLAPKQRKDFTLSIDLPKDEPPSDYYFSVVFQTLEGNPAESNNSNALIGIAANILLSIGPKTKAQGQIEEFSSPFFIEKGPVPFTVRVKNNSSYFIAPKGTILITNMFGQTIGKVDLLPVNILSNSIRAIPDSLQAGENKYGSPKSVWPETFLLGPYQATLNIALSEQGPVFKKTTYFLAFPVQALTGLGIALLIILFVRNRIKQYNK